MASTQLLLINPKAGAEPSTLSFVGTVGTYQLTINQQRNPDTLVRGW